MKSTNRKIDDYLKKKRRELILVLVPCLLMFTVFFGWFMMPTMGSVSQESGVVTKLIGIPSEEGEKLFMMVKLDNGVLVRSYIANSSFYKEGKRVNLEKQEPLLFGRPVYRFRGYASGGA